MKTKILFIALLVLPLIGFGQNRVKEDLPEIEVKPPAFTGIENYAEVTANGQVDLMVDYLNKNIQYPEEAAECYKEGTAVVEFVVKANGELTGFNVINSVCPAIDREFIRVLKTTTGMWKPGLNNEIPVNMEKEVSMMFVASQANKNAEEYFSARAKNFFTQGNELFFSRDKARKALKHYNNSIKYDPYETASLMMRGLCRYELGDREGACSDWERINKIGKYDASWLNENICGLKGYAEMIKTLEE